MGDQAAESDRHGDVRGLPAPWMTPTTRAFTVRLLTAWLALWLLSACNQPTPPATTPPVATATAAASTATVVLPSRPAASSTPSATQPSTTPTLTTMTQTATTLPTPTAASTNAPVVSPTLAATSTPAPQPTRATTPTAAPTVSLYERQITLNTYPFAAFQREVTDPVFNWSWRMLDRAAYEAAQPQPTPQALREVVLENEFLRLGVLPDLGGRLIECYYKPTRHQVFYRNPVLKPSPWGPPGRDGLEAGWLAAGGVEWGIPVEEHGYAWGTPWGYDTPQPSPDEATITVFQEPQGRLQISVDITLRAGEAAFTVRTRLTNATGQEATFKYWINAMLAPGGRNRPGPELRLILPINEVTVHSTGDSTLPGSGQAMSWPIFQGRDLSRLGNWRQYLGFFARPAAAAGFAGVYDLAADEGLARVFPADVMRGVKFFGLGWSDPLPAALYTDDGSSYVEMHGGLAPTFDQRVNLGAGETLYWEETWFPVAGIGTFVYADQDGAVNLRATAQGLQIAIYPVRSFSGKLTVSVDGAAIANLPVTLNPARPFDQVIAVPANVPARAPVAVQLLDAEGTAILQFEQEMTLR